MHMRYSFIIVFVFVTVGIHAQVETERNTNVVIENNMSTTNEILEEVSEEEEAILADSSAYKLEEDIDELQIEKIELKESAKPAKKFGGKNKRDRRATQAVPVMTREAEKDKETIGGMEAEDAIDTPAPAPVTANEGAGYINKPVSVDQQSYPGSSAAEYGSYTNTYNINRLSASEQRCQRSPSIEQQAQMDGAVEYFEQTAPNSFEFNYFKYTAGNYDVSLVDNLKKAEELRPENSDVHAQMAAYHMIKDESAEAMIYMQKLIESQRLTQDVLFYTEDVLSSAPENGTLITHGFDDSYGVWYAQNENSVRKDVTLISLDFLQSEQYRNDLETKGYKFPKSSTINVEFVNEFCELNKEKALSLSLTTPKEYFVPMKDNLYVVGLVFEYHEDKFDNYYKNDYLWNEGLNKHLIENAQNDKAKQLSANYLPMLLQLQRVYQQKGDAEKTKDVDEASDKVGVQSRKYEQVKKLKASY